MHRFVINRKLQGLVVVVLVFHIHLQAQQVIGQFSTMQTRATRTLTIDDGFATDCFQDILTDETGRLWLTPCNEAQRNRELHLFQFDGFEAIVHDLEYAPGTSINLSGAIGDSILFGTELLGKSIWFYNYRSGQVHKSFAKIDSGYLFNTMAIEKRIFAIGAAPGQLMVFERVNDSLQLIDQIPAKYFHVPYRLTSISREAKVFEGQIVTIDLLGDLHYFNPKTNQLKTRKLNIAKAHPGDYLLEWQGYLHLVRQQESAIYRIEADTAYKINILPQGWHLMQLTDNFVLRNLAFADESGNIIVYCVDPKGRPKTLLIDDRNEIWDFTEVEEGLPESRWGRLMGVDFKQKLFKCGGRITIVEIAHDFGITKLPSSAGRNIAALDAATLICSPEGNVQLITNDLTQVTSRLPQRLEEFTSGKNLRPTTLINDRMGRLWAGQMDTLKLFDPVLNKTYKYTIGGFPDNFVKHEDGIIIIDKGHFIYCTHHGELKTDTLFDGLSEFQIGTINAIVPSKDVFWLASSRGLWKIDTKSSSLDHIDLGSDEYRVLSMIMISDEQLVLGTESSGVLFWDPETGKSKSIHVDQGLSHNTVAGLLQDESDNIWVNTFSGVSVLSPDREVIARFYEEDGLVNNEGNRWSSYKHHDGRLVFGSIAGYTVIDPDKALHAVLQNKPPLVWISKVTHADYHGNSVSMDNPRQITAFRLPANRRTIRIDIGLSDYVSSAQSEFTYKYDLPGYDWTPAGKSSPVFLSNMPPGEYAVFIRGRIKNGIWSDNEAFIQVHVAKPFYKTIWFLILMAMPVVLSIAIWIGRSLRERRRLETEVRLRTNDIERQAEELRQMDIAKSRIYTNITHEFRTPLTIIKGLTGQLQGSRNSISMLQHNADRLLNLVNQMLDLSKLESKTLEVHFVSGNIVDAIREVFDSFSPLAEIKDLSMHFHARPENIIMDFDVDILFRIIGNLMSNAIKYTPAGGNVYMNVGIEKRTDQEYLVMFIRDTGVGIDREKLPHIFDRFYQVDGSMTRAGEGTGIGLALVKELVDLLQGHIAVESEINRGTTFITELPVRQDAVEKYSPAERFADNLIVSGESVTSGNEIGFHSDQKLPTVLIVDDTPDLLHYLSLCLQEDYTILLAMDGQAGIDKAIEEVPDVIVSDVMMPVKNGFELCTAVKSDEHSSHIPVILLTAKAEMEAKIEGLSSGADGYIVKPFEKDELLLTIRNALNARHAIRQRYTGEFEEPVVHDPEIQKQDAFIKRLNTLIDENLEDDTFGVMPLSRGMQYSRSQLHNKVKALTGFTISTYIQHRRLSKARILLKQADTNISEVAWAVGFKDPKYFSRLFKREFGVSPREFVEKSSTGPSDT